MSGQWHDEQLFIPDADVNHGAHLSNEIWLDHQNGAFVELGLARGCGHAYDALLGQSCTNVSGIERYEWFWGEKTPSTGYKFHPLSAALTADGANHAYQIWNQSNGTNNSYKIFIDYGQVGATQDQTNPTGNLVQTGMELTSFSGINSNEKANQVFHNYIQKYRNDGSGWTYANFSTTIDHSFPCGTDDCATDPCSDHPIGFCLTFARNLDYEWSDSKPTN